MVLADDVSYIGTQSKMLVYNPLCSIRTIRGNGIVIKLAIGFHIYYNEIRTMEIKIIDPSGTSVYSESMNHFFDSQREKYGEEFYLGTAGFTADEGVNFTQSGLHKAAISLNNQSLFETHFYVEMVGV
jgi:hypothetical protein